jgi:hypothetical protein
MQPTASEWYDSNPDLSRLEQGDVLEGVPVVFGPPKSKRWILLRPLPQGSPLESAESGLPKQFRGDVDSKFSSGWTRPEELVLARAWVDKIMVVSQSCEISWRKHIQVAPVGEAEVDFKEEKLQKLCENQYGYLFFLPPDPPGFPASYADLSRITAVDASYFRADALLKRLSSRGMIELQSSLTDLYGRAIGFTVDDDVPQAARYACVSCFTLGKTQVHKSISIGGKFPDCPGCGAQALWIKLP